MKGFLQLTEQQNNGQTIWINGSNISTIRGTTNATIYMMNGQHFTVQESVPQVVDQFNGLDHQQVLRKTA